jgi:hypothetical protein
VEWQGHVSTGLQAIAAEAIRSLWKELARMNNNTTAERPANDEMIEGYYDGRDSTSPEPSGNRSYSYRHGFLNGRDDRSGKPRATAAELREQADLAMDLDGAIATREAYRHDQ